MFSTPNPSLPNRRLLLEEFSLHGQEGDPCASGSIHKRGPNRKLSKDERRSDRRRIFKLAHDGPPSGFKDPVSLVGGWHGRVGWQNRGFVRTSFTVPSGARLGAAVQHFSPIASTNDAQ